MYSVVEGGRLNFKCEEEPQALARHRTINDERSKNYEGGSKLYLFSFNLLGPSTCFSVSISDTLCECECKFSLVI